MLRVSCWLGRQVVASPPPHDDLELDVVLGPSDVPVRFLLGHCLSTPLHLGQGGQVRRPGDVDTVNSSAIPDGTFEITSATNLRRKKISIYCV